METTTKKGIQWLRLFGDPARHPFQEVRWVERDAVIKDARGKVTFKQKNVTVPEFWEEQSYRIAASKYFRVPTGGTKEHSVKQLLERVARTIASKGLELGYFSSAESCENFQRDIVWLTLNQFMAFNSPVWFNVGIEEHPQCSACFILSVEDNMKSILNWFTTEGMIFKQGSGSGINVSTLRSSKEKLSRGGIASGPVSLMHGADSVANIIKSGGATRRAAKMVILNADHPDIRDFIRCKVEMEKMARTLETAGFDASLDGKLFSIYTTLPYQNANNSVRVTDEFMQAVLVDGDWQLKAVKTGEVLETVKAHTLLREIADAAWASADPGMQYDTTINRWHTCPNTARINASNPCSEYMHIDDSACNLASLNLLKFLRGDGTFDVGLFKKAVRTTILAQEIAVGLSSYPTEKIGENARKFRELGLGYANLGALLMVLGYPYDSEGGRTLAAGITALMTGEAYRYSAEIASVVGPCEGFSENREPMRGVIAMHRDETHKLVVQSEHAEPLIREAVKVWDEAYALIEQYGARNTQATVLAPTGTIAFLMACDTTGVEPDTALVKYKNLVGGGQLVLENRQVSRALTRLGYSDVEAACIVAHLKTEGCIEGAPGLKEEHLAVFDCAFKAKHGTRTISWQGHVKMMAAVQPFISGAISKTVNLPKEATVEDFENAFMESWKSGLKAVAFYRDGSKTTQPLSTEKGKTAEEVKPVRKRLPHTRKSLTHKFSIAGHEGYLMAGMYGDGRLGEIFLEMSKEGSTLSGLADSFATTVSIALQYGVPLKDLAKKFLNRRFEPAGMTENPDIRFTTSLSDYVFRWLAAQFLSHEELEEIGLLKKEGNGLNRNAVSAVTLPTTSLAAEVETAEDGQTCTECGTLMQRTGSCYTCPQCGNNTGCG